MKYYSLYFAQVYGEDSYGEGDYSCTEKQQTEGICTAAGGMSGSSSGGGLADTGTAILSIVTLASTVMLAALIVRIWRRPKPVLQEVEADELQELVRRSDDRV
jgi:hypothetical protein